MLDVGGLTSLILFVKDYLGPVKDSVNNKIKSAALRE